jgi:hypothetical protein
MGLYNMMITSASGMAAQTNWLGTISDNIANAKTTGYKNAGRGILHLVVSGGVGEYTSAAANHTRYDILRQGVLTIRLHHRSPSRATVFRRSDPEGTTFTRAARSSRLPTVLGQRRLLQAHGREISGGTRSPRLTINT